MPLKKKKLLTFLLILIILLIPISLICWLALGSVYWPYLLALLYMPMPAVAAIITQKFIYHQPLRALGFQKIKFRSLLLFPIVSSFLLFTGLLAGSFILGNILKVPGFGYITDDSLVMLKNVVGNVEIPAGTDMPPMILLIPLTFVSAIVAGFTINGLFALGEELGWRGFLLNELKPLGFFKANLLIGIIWGLWHAPLILMGYNYPTNPILGVFAMNLVTIPLGFILAIARIKSNSVLASAVGHGAFNGFASLTIFVLVGANIFLGTVLGIWGFVVLSIIATLLYLGNKQEIINWYNQRDN